MIDYYTKRTLKISELYYLLDTKFNECNNNKRGMYITYYKIKNEYGVCENILVPRSLFLQDEKIGGIYAIPIIINVQTNFKICHYNMLIIDFGRRIVERFEPVNSYDYDNLDILLRKCFKERGYTYEISKTNGPQCLEMREVGITLNCGYWILYFLNLRLQNKSLSFAKVMELCISILSKNGAHNTLKTYKDELNNYLKINSEHLKYYESKIYNEFSNKYLLDYYLYKF